MITLYSNGCQMCNVVKKRLDESNKRYDMIKVSPETAEALKAKGHRSMPVMECGEWSWDGQDCLIAIEEGEV